MSTKTRFVKCVALNKIHCGYTTCYTTMLFIRVILLAMMATSAAQGMTILCDAPALFSESRFLFQANATSFDKTFALAIDTHCWPSVSADGTEVAVVDTWETRLDQHMSEIHNRLQEMSQMLEQWNVDESEHKEDHEEDLEEEDLEEEDQEEDHEEEDQEEDQDHQDLEEDQMEAGKIVPEIIV